MTHVAMLGRVHKPKHQGYELRPLGRRVVGLVLFLWWYALLKPEGKFLSKNGCVKPLEPSCPPNLPVNTCYSGPTVC